MSSNIRLNFLLGGFFLIGFIILAKLFYWQIILSDKLTAAAENQHWVSFEIPAQRGKILTNDGFPLVTNKEAFLVFAVPPDLDQPASEISKKLSEVLELGGQEDISALIEERLVRQDLFWVPIKHKVFPETKSLIDSLGIKGVGFREESTRDYPEGSTSAHLLGFVGSDINGRDKGYFGLEGYYDLELKGQPGMLYREKDASGKPILVGKTEEEKEKDGRDLITSIDRTVQFISEKYLQEGLTRYGAKSGSIVVMDPKNGEILAMTSLPAYDSNEYWKFDKKLFPNPAISSSFEPGSIFKVIVMSAALNEGVIKPETQCDRCNGSRNIGGYTIRTWNDKYPPDPSMTEIIQQSNNVGMVFVGEKLGIDRTFKYLKDFGIGQSTGIDLEDEDSPQLRPKDEWREIDLATAAFGQGVAVTPIQMVRAVGAIANKGRLMRPHVVRKVISENGTMEVKPRAEREVIKPNVARVMTEIMVNAIEKGEAKGDIPPGYRIAGKTGTAQVPIQGHYDEKKTVASFIGFAPADDPKFVMLVTLIEPTYSPWGSRTAAPLWFEIAKELFTYYGILPSGL